MKTNETKVHYKMYKIGKKWAVAAIAVGTFSLASGYTLTSAHADDTAVTTEQTLPVSSAADVVEPATELTSSAVSAVDSSAVAEVEAPAAIETPQSTAPITTSSAAPTTSVATSAAPKAAAANVIQKNNKNYTQVTRENFADYFNLNGSAQYDADSGIITITENKQNQVGNFSLKEKINMDEDFTLKGKVNIGNSKAVINKIADGIGFAFHEGNTTDIGEDGGNLGIGGLVGAIGFKLDTFHNEEQQPTNTGTKDSYGWAADPTNHTPYGAFAYTNKTPELINGRNVYWAYADADSVEKLQSNILDGSFHDFTIEYVNHVLTITLDIKKNKEYVWTKTVDAGQSAMAMIISASTGWGATRQEFQFESFEYTAASTVNVRYVDQNNEDIELPADLIEASKPSYTNGESIGSKYSTNKLEIPGYRYVGMGEGSIPTEGTLTDIGDNGTVIYVYEKVNYTSEFKTVSQTINYLDVNDHSNKLAESSVQTIGFVTVKENDKNPITYYLAGATEVPELDSQGNPPAGWTAVTTEQAAYKSWPHADVTNYHVVSTSQTPENLTEVVSTPVSVDDENSTINVYYGIDYTWVVDHAERVIEYVDQSGAALPDTTPDIQEISFVTVIDPTKGNNDPGTVYYALGMRDLVDVDSTGVPIGEGWHLSDTANYTSVPHPDVTNYHVIAISDELAGDLTNVNAQTVTKESGNSKIIVTYAPNYSVSGISVTKRNISYVKTDGTSAESSNNIALTFIEVNNPATGVPRYFVSFGEQPIPILNDEGTPEGFWSTGSHVTLSANPHPTVPNYTVISTSNPEYSDLNETFDCPAFFDPANTPTVIDIVITYDQSYAVTDHKVVNQTVKYVDQQGAEIGFDANEQALTFVTVTSVKDIENPITYYQADNLAVPTLDEAGVPLGGWTLMDNNSRFTDVPHPTDSRYKIISTSDTENSNLEEVFARNISITDSDHEIVITYAPDYQIRRQMSVDRQVNYETEDGTPVKPSLKDSVRFVSVYNPVTENSIGYYNTGEYAPVVLDVNGRPTGDWTEGNTYDLIEVPHPSVDNYRVISTDNAGITDLEKTFLYPVSFDPNNDTNMTERLSATIVYAPAYSVTAHKTVNQTIKYVDQNGDHIGFNDNLQSVSFISVTNPDTNESVTYYKIGTHGEPSLDTSGVPGDGWALMDANSVFLTVPHPFDSRYTVVNTSDPENSDLL